MKPMQQLKLCGGPRLRGTYLKGVGGWAKKSAQIRGADWRWGAILSKMITDLSVRVQLLFVTGEMGFRRDRCIGLD